MSEEAVPIYIDLKSPYSYVAAHRALALEETGKVIFDWWPFVLNTAGRAKSDPGSFIRRARYIYRDVRRFATPLGLTIKGPKQIHDSTLASIALLSSKNEGAHRRYIAECYRRFFDRDLELDNVKAIKALLADCGVDTSKFASYAAGEGKDLLATCQAEADAIGVFAVPTFVIGSELYWGQDRMDMAMTAAGVV